jgi:Flp pilus assembly protein TadG
MLLRSRIPSNRPAGRRLRRATAAVEFALVLPFLALLVNGFLEVGQAIMVREVLNDAVRKACRKGALPNQNNAAITADVTDILNDNFSSTATASATITILVNGQAVDASTAVKGDQISVKVSMSFSQVAWTPLFFLASTFVESETLVMARQG